MKISKKLGVSITIDTILAAIGAVCVAIATAFGETQSHGYYSAVRVMTTIELAILAIIVVVEAISMYKISDSTVHTLLTALAVLGYMVFSPDFLNTLADDGIFTDGKYVAVINFAFMQLTMLSMIYFWNYTYRARLSKKFAVLLCSLSAATTFAYSLLMLVRLEIIAFAAFSVVIGFALAIIYRRIDIDAEFRTTELLNYSVYGSCLAMTLCNMNGHGLSPVGMVSFYNLPVIFVYIAVYISFAMRTDRTAITASEYKLRYEKIKSDALRAQIKPHFVFNALAAVQSLYHKSTEDGDAAINLFAKHLRANVEAVDADLIPFEKELDNVSVYVDLENIRSEDKFNVIFDVEFTDFMLPMLSLQPYVENAIKHSKVNKKKDGYVKISTVKHPDYVTLTVEDNGVGFDPQNIPETSCGINNSCERLLVLMNAKPQIESQIGKGTRVTIKIPLKRESKNANNNS